MGDRSHPTLAPGLGWMLLGLAAGLLAAYVAVETIRAGAINQGLVLAGVGAVVVPSVAYAAGRAGQGWGRPLAIAFGIGLMALAALGEWFFWIGDFQGVGYQKIGAALPFAAIEGLAAAGTGLLATRGQRRGRVAVVAVAAMLVPAMLGQLTVWGGS